MQDRLLLYHALPPELGRVITIGTPDSALDRTWERDRSTEKKHRKKLGESEEKPGRNVGTNH